MAAADTVARSDAGSAQTEAADSAEAPATEETSAPAQTDAVASTISEIGAPGDVTPSIHDEQSLRTYVANAAVRLAANQCITGGDENLGNVNYQDTAAVVGRDPSTGEVLVYATVDCTVLVVLPD